MAASPGRAPLLPAGAAGAAHEPLRRHWAREAAHWLLVLATGGLWLLASVWCVRRAARLRFARCAPAAADLVLASDEHGAELCAVEPVAVQPRAHGRGAARQDTLGGPARMFVFRLVRFVFDAEHRDFVPLAPSSGATMDAGTLHARLRAGTPAAEHRELLCT